MAVDSVNDGPFTLIVDTKDLEAPSNRTEVSFMKVITTVVGELGTNCYLLIDEATREAALIDPADSPDELSALIEREGVTLRYILLTHGHRDHTLAAPAMHKRYPAAAVYIHRLDANGSGIYHYPLEGVIDGLTITTRAIRSPSAR